MSDPRARHIERLQEAIMKAAEFRSQGLSSWTPEFRAWHDKIIQSLAAAGAGPGYKERFESLSFDDPYVSPDTRLFDSRPGTFDADLQIAQDVIKEALEDIPIAAGPPKGEVDVLVTGHGGQGGSNAKWYDVAQVCLNGHLVNDRTKSSPEHNQAFCGKCGKPTISACPRCNSPIRGYYHVPRVVSLGSEAVDNFCLSCGAPYPWTAEKLEAAKAYADEAEDLSPEEKEALKKSFDDLIVDSPKTKLAAIRFKKLLPKIGQQIGGALRELLIDIVSEAAKKALWPGP